MGVRKPCCAGSIRAGHGVPGQFIPIAEKSGLILPISEWVLRTASAAAGPLAGQRAAADDHGSERVGGAVPPPNLRPGGPHPGRGRLCHPACLELELTKGVASNDPRPIAIMADLRHGGALSIDDFGTRLASSSWHAFQVYKLKIDRSFVRTSPWMEDPGHRQCRHQHGLQPGAARDCRRVGQEQLDVLRAKGCGLKSRAIFQQASARAECERFCAHRPAAVLPVA